MKAGKFASLILLTAMTAIAFAVVVTAAYFQSQGAGASMFAGRLGLLVQLSLLAFLFALVLLPLGFALDRSIDQLRSYMKRAADSGQWTTDLAANRRSIAWLNPVTSVFVSALDQFHQRELSLRNQIRDLEIRHRVSEAERRQTEAVLHALHDPVIVTDAFNEIVMANTAAATIFGFDLKEAMHKPIDRVISDERICRMINDAREAGNFSECRNFEYELSPPRAREAQRSAPFVSDDDALDPYKLKATEVPAIFNVTLAAVENHKHEVAGVVTILHDLTREREVSQMKTDFVSKASHELRTPLSSIRAYVEMLVDGEATDEKSRNEFYRVIQNETDRLGRLIDNMLNISRIEAGIVQIERENVDIKPLVQRAIQSLEPHAREKDISLHTKLATLDLTVEGDADMLYQVVLNLASNAVKYTPEGGRITISADSDNLTRSVVVTVADTGLGIPPDAVQKVFDKFYRVENYKRVAKGTGLGLSLCKHIVETVHHGQIGVESKLGMGSKFWFSVPMRYAGSQAA